MKSPKYSLVILVTMVMIEQSCESSFAFNIKGQTSNQSVSAQVSIPGTNVNGIVTVSTKKINEIKRGGTSDFLKILTQSYGGLKFERGGNLKGDFNILTYYPCDPSTECGSEVAQNYPGLFPIPFSGYKNGVGASISVDYERTPDDAPNVNNVAWIQRAKVNTGGQQIRVIGSGFLGASFDVIDSLPNSPFYPGASYLGRANPQTGQPSYSLIDVPYNLAQNPQPSYVYNNDWSFELYLAELVTSNKANVAPKIKIYNGISWGWTSKFTPNPTPKPCSSASGGGGCATPSPVPINSVIPVSTPRPTPRPAPSPSPTPRPTPRPAPAPAPSPRPAPAPAPSPRPAPAPAPSPRPAPAPAPSSGGRPIQAVPRSWVPNANVSNLRKSSLFESGSKSSNDYAQNSNENNAVLATISADLLEDPELSYLDDTLIAKTPKVSAKNTDDDALSAEAVPEPTTALGTLLALAVFPVIKKLKNRKSQE